MSTNRMTNTFTKGPWRASDAVGRNLLSYSQSSAVMSEDSKQLICGCFMDVSGGEIVASANARLIACAPELVQALIDLQTQIHAAVKFDVKKHYSLMVADAAATTAIQKATNAA